MRAVLSRMAAAVSVLAVVAVFLAINALGRSASVAIDVRLDGTEIMLAGVTLLAALLNR